MSAEEIQGIINGLLEVEEGLSRWELDFVESIEEWFEDKGWLTDKQLNRLTELYDDKC